ncbi:MAG: hypothetical protein ABMA64_17225 [Myxococcota bacterium]
MWVAAWLGCGDPSGGGGISAASYGLAPGLELVFAPTDAPDGPARTLRGADGQWELRDGESWDDGSVVGVYEVSTADGLRVDDTLLLPPYFRVGTTEGGVTVTEVGPIEVYYGTFDPAVRVEVDAGAWAGPQVFAQGFGPARLTLDGTTWDLVTYDHLPE